MKINVATMYRLLGFLLLSQSSYITGAAKARAAKEKPYCELSDHAARFNFTRLSESAEDRVVVDEKFGQTVRLRLCGPLRKSCNGANHYSVCLTTKDNEEKGIGKSPPDLVSANAGLLKFQFTGDVCREDKPYTVQVIMKCDNDAGYDSQPELFPRESADSCMFHLVWRTKAACGEEHTVDCKAVENNRHYDLSSLTLRSENYKIPLPNVTDSEIILNVCHSVIYEHGATCTPKAGACLRASKPSNKTEYANLGDVSKPPYFENGVLTLKYEVGEMCKRVKGKGHVDTVISFQCDRRATNTQPEYEGGAENCVHRLNWKTAAACSIESLASQSVTVAGTCKVTDPLTNIEYNFQELMGKDFRSKSQSGAVYTFRICGSITGSDSCPAGAGACNAKDKISMGSANANLTWSQGGPYLNYTDGAECGKNQRRYTQIAFFCGAEGTAGMPIVMEENDCAVIIHWNTPLVCDKRIKCETKYGEMSLTSLIRWNDNYVVKTNDTEFHINVCRPLVPKPYLTCLHGSAACQAVRQADAKFANETSLGYPSENPFIDDEKHVILRYTGGSPCQEDKRSALSSNLTFICNYSTDTGTPRYKYYRGCTHVFEWSTSVVCENIEGRWGTAGCVVENPRLSQTIDLALLRDKPVYSVKSQSGDQYNVSLCGGIKYCNGSAVCKANDSYGSPSGVIFDYTKKAIILKFSRGSRCKTGSYSSEVKLICDEAAGNGEPKFVETQSSETSCNAVFEWRTRVACVNQSTLKGPTSGGDSIDIEPVQTVVAPEEWHGGKYIGIAILVFCCIALIIYLWSSKRRAHLRSCFNSLTTRRDRCRAQYTKVNATEEARLLLDIEETTQCQTDSDSDDELLDA